MTAVHELMDTFKRALSRSGMVVFCLLESKSTLVSLFKRE